MDEIANVIESLENISAALKLPFSASIHVAAVKELLPKYRARLVASPVKNDEVEAVIQSMSNILAAANGINASADVHLAALRRSIPEQKERLLKAYLAMGGVYDA